MIDEELVAKVRQVFRDDINLLGNFHFDDDEIETLKVEFTSAAKRNSTSFNYSIDEISYFVIVVVNKLRDWNKEWSENGFWDQINLIFDDDYFIYVLLEQFRIKLYDAIDNLFREYNRVLFKTKGDKRAFAQTFLYHALAPKISLEHFIDLAWKKYFDDLECDYTSSDMVFCEYVINSLKKKIISPDEDEDIQFGSTYYRLRTAFKYGIVQNTEKTIKLLDNILTSINKVDRNNEDLEENTINKIISSVVAKNKRIVIKNNSGASIIHKESNTAHTFGQLKPILCIDFAQHDKPRIYIRVPRLILLGTNKEYIYADVSLFRENPNGSKTLLKTFPRRLFKNNGEHSYTLSAFEEELTDIYYAEESEFHYEFRIATNNGLEYSSNNSFYRDILLFNSEKEIQGNTKPGNYSLMVPRAFDLSTNVHFLKKNYRLLWKNIYSIATDDFDSIEYGSTEILFSQQGMPSNVLFENQELSCVEGVKILKQGIVYDVFTSYSNLLINKESDTSAEAIRIHHIYRDVSNNVIINEEKRLSELERLNHRYFYDEIDNGLSSEGYHLINVKKIASNVLSNKILLDRKYIIDPKFKIEHNCLPYLDGDGEGKLRLFGAWTTFEITQTSDNSVFQATDSDIGVLVENPFFNWWFGSSPNNIHYSQINPKKPIIVTDFESTNETVIINTSLPIDKLFYKDNINQKPLEVFCGESNKTFLLKQFINSGHKKGSFFCIHDKREIPLFSITDRPYNSDSVSLEDCLFLENNTFKINISEYFIHDNANYSVFLYLKDRNGRISKWKINKLDDENVFENTNLDDGEYEAKITYAKNYLGDEEPEVALPSCDIVLGDIQKKAFEEIDSIILRPTRNFRTGEKLKMDGYYIDSIAFNGYDELGYCVFDGILKSKMTKPQKVRFTHKDGCLIKNLSLVYGKENEIVKKANFDDTKKCFTADPVSNTVAEFKTIYYK